MNNNHKPAMSRSRVAVLVGVACAVVALAIGFAIPQLNALTSTGETPALLQTVDQANENTDAATPADDDSNSNQNAGADSEEQSGTEEASPDQNDQQGQQQSDGPAGGSQDSRNSHDDPTASGQGSNERTGATGDSSSDGTSAKNAMPAAGSKDDASNSSPSSEDTSHEPFSQQKPSEDKLVTVEINSSAIGGTTTTASVAWKENMSPYDALVAIGSNVNARDTQFGTYVAAIDGLAEKQHGGSSGWLYYVNGVKPDYGVSYCKLNPGDVVEWRYTVNGVS